MIKLNLDRHCRQSKYAEFTAPCPTLKRKKMIASPVKKKLICTHCGLPARKEIEEKGEFFCCHGCKTARNFLSLSSCELPEIKAPGKQEEVALLDTDGVLEKRTIARQENSVRIRLKNPEIHCASCVQVLE